MTGVFKFFKNYKAITAAAAATILLQSFGTLFIPTLMADIVNIGIANGDLPYIYMTGAKMIVTAIFTAAVAMVGAWLAACLSARWGKDIRNAVFIKAQTFSLRDFSHFGTASMITRCTNDATLLQDSLLVFFQLMLPAPFIAIGGLILAFSKDAVMALIIVGAIIALFCISGVLFKKVIPLYTRLRLDMDEMNRILRERIAGVRVIRAFNRGKHEQKRADKIFGDYSETTIKINKLFAIMMPFVITVINICALLIIWFGGKRAGAGIIQIGDIMALVEYAMLIFWTLVMGVSMLMMLPRATACAERINEVLRTTPDINDGEQLLPDTNEQSVVSFQNVSFGYYNAEEPILQNLNFDCKKGETTAIIGGTGSGKSTIANLIMRFYDIQAGQILWNGVDIRKVPQAELRKRIGYIPQKGFLFSGTVAYNLRFGDNNATAEQLKRASNIAQAEGFLDTLPNGYDSFVSQGGTNFSGGQRQRLCIARALTRQADLYLFDDSFSALDFKTDADLRAAIKAQVKNAAIVVVAQRISSIIDADKIVVLDNGGIAAIGTHQELLNTCDVYREIVKSQLKEDLI